MQDTTNKFQLSYNLALIEVEKMEDHHRETFRINFSNEVPPIIITCIPDRNGVRTWDSLPHGNKELAEGIGFLIEEYLKNKY